MQQVELFDLPSPCRGICEVNSKGYCKGCFRSRDERLYWMRLSNEHKKTVLTRCNNRRKKYLHLLAEQQKSPEEPMNQQADLFDF